MSLARLGVCYYPEHWPAARWSEDAREMRALGISLVRIGEFAWRRIEPRFGQFDWDWLDRAIATLADAGLDIVMGTPTACPPDWLVSEAPEILPHGADGRARGFGSRRHYSFSSERYLGEAIRITTALAERYGRHPAIVGWQTDNEYGCHDTTLCYSDAALAAFRAWLRERYASIEALNEAWGNVFWSQQYSSFDAVGLPLAVTETNPAHRLAFRRFSSDQVCRFNAAQVDVLRRHCEPGTWLTHNFMGEFTDFDHYAVMTALDVASWDSYPLGFLDQGDGDETDKHRYRRSGHPDWAAFHHDLYRGVGDGRFGVMEQQPGAVNWAGNNAQPEDGMVLLWSLEAIAHGAEFVSWFRWRQAPFAQEQMHAGLLLPDASPARASVEVRQLRDVLTRLPDADTGPAPVALVFDYTACWMTDIQPHAAGYRALDIAQHWYGAARRLGLDVDIVSPDADLQGYALVLLPCQPELPATLASALRTTDAAIIAGPRIGSKTDEFTIPDTLPPGRLQDLIDVRVVSVDALRPGIALPLRDDPTQHVRRWLEQIESSLSPARTTDDGRGVIYRNTRCSYIAGDVCQPGIAAELVRWAAERDVPVTRLPDSVRTRRRGRLQFVFNYGDAVAALPVSGTCLYGGETLPPYSAAVWQLPA